MATRYAGARPDDRIVIYFINIAPGCREYTQLKAAPAYIYIRVVERVVE